MYRTRLRAGTRRVAAGAVAGAQLGGGAVSARSLAPRGIGLENMGRASVATPRVRNVAITKIASVITVADQTVPTSATVIQTLDMKRNAAADLDIWVYFELVPKQTPNGTALDLTIDIRRDGSILKTYATWAPMIQEAGASSANNWWGGPINVPWVDDDELNGTHTYDVRLLGGYDFLGTPTALSIDIRNRYLRLWERQK